MVFTELNGTIHDGKSAHNAGENQEMHDADVIFIPRHNLDEIISDEARMSAGCDLYERPSHERCDPIVWDVEEAHDTASYVDNALMREIATPVKSHATGALEVLWGAHLWGVLVIVRRRDKPSTGECKGHDEDGRKPGPDVCRSLSWLVQDVTRVGILHGVLGKDDSREEEFGEHEVGELRVIQGREPAELELQTLASLEPSDGFTVWACRLMEIPECDVHCELVWVGLRIFISHKLYDGLSSSVQHAIVI